MWASREPPSKSRLSYSTLRVSTLLANFSSRKRWRLSFIVVLSQFSPAQQISFINMKAFPHCCHAESFFRRIIFLYANESTIFFSSFELSYNTRLLFAISSFDSHSSVNKTWKQKIGSTWRHFVVREVEEVLQNYFVNIPEWRWQFVVRGIKRAAVGRCEILTNQFSKFLFLSRFY